MALQALFFGGTGIINPACAQVYPDSTILIPSVLKSLVKIRENRKGRTCLN